MINWSSPGLDFYLRVGAVHVSCLATTAWEWIGYFMADGGPIRWIKAIRTGRLAEQGRQIPAGGALDNGVPLCQLNEWDGITANMAGSVTCYHLPLTPGAAVTCLTLDRSTALRLGCLLRLDPVRFAEKSARIPLQKPMQHRGGQKIPGFAHSMRPALKRWKRRSLRP